MKDTIFISVTNSSTSSRKTIIKFLYIALIAIQLIKATNTNNNHDASNKQLISVDANNSSSDDLNNNHNNNTRVMDDARFCQYTSDDGYQYDNLIKLMRDSSSNISNYYNAINYQLQYAMYINICGVVRDVGCAGDSENNNNNACCMENAFSNFYPCGLLSSMKISAYVNETTNKVQSDSGVTISYYNNNSCYLNTALPTQTSILLTCDPDIDLGSIVLKEINTCHFHVYISSRWACPTSRRRTDTAKMVFVISIVTLVIIVSILLYLTTHTLINMYCYSKKGIEAVPLYRLFSVCGFCFDCCHKRNYSSLN